MAKDVAKPYMEVCRFYWCLCICVFFFFFWGGGGRGGGGGERESCWKCSLGSLQDGALHETARLLLHAKAAN